MTRVVRFLVVTFGWSWAVGGVLALTGGFGTPLRQTIGGFIFMLGPALGALAATHGLPSEERRGALGLSLRFDRWLFVAWLAPMVLIVLAILGAGLGPETHVTSPAAALVAKLTQLGAADQAAKVAALPSWLLSAGLVVQAFVFGAALNAPLMLSEELGWRGALWTAWVRLGFWKQSLLTGALWGVWHGPLIAMGYNFPDAPLLGVALMVVFCLLLSPLFQVLRARGGTVWHACVCHGTINAGARLSELCVSSDHWYGRGLLGVSGFSVLALACVAVAVLERRR